MTDYITVKGDDIANVKFTKSCNPLGFVEKQTTKCFVFEDGEVKRIDVTYAVQFDISQVSLARVFDQAVKDAKTGIGNDLRKKSEKDAKAGHNATLDFFNNVLLKDGKLEVVGLNTVLPKTPESPEQQLAQAKMYYSQMTPEQQKEFLESCKQ